MTRSKVWVAALATALLLDAIGASSALAVKTGPHFFVGGFPLETSKNIVGTGGTTKIASSGTTFECSSVKTVAGSHIEGVSPGKGKITLRMESCKSGLCEVHSVAAGETSESGVIKIPLNVELTYNGTEQQALEEKPPLAVLFRSTESKKALLVETLSCGLLSSKIEATGNNKNAGTFGIQGMAAVIVNIPEPEVEKVEHAAEAHEPPQTIYRYWDETGKLQNVTAELKISGEVAALSMTLLTHLETLAAFSAKAK